MQSKTEEKQDDTRLGRWCTSYDVCVAAGLTTIPSPTRYPRNRWGSSSPTNRRATWSNLTSIRASHSEGRRETTDRVAERGTTGEAFHDSEDPRRADDLQDECPDDAEEDSGGGDRVEGQFGECDVGGTEGTEGRMLDPGRKGESLGRVDG